MKVCQKQFVRVVTAVCCVVSCFVSLSLKAEETDVPHLLVVYCSGGWDTTMVFDSKIGLSAVSTESGPSAVLATGAGDIPYVDHSSRSNVKDFFDAYGAGAVIVNGVNAGSMSKKFAVRNMFGYTPKGLRRPIDWVTYYTVSLKPGLSLPHLVIGAPYMPGEYSSIVTKLDDDSIDNYIETGVTSAAAVDETALNALYAATYGSLLNERNTKSSDYEKLKALVFGYYKEGTVDSVIETGDSTYSGLSSFVDRAKYAIDLFASGDSYSATIQAGATDDWDTTQDATHFTTQAALYNSLFGDLSEVLVHAATKGIDDKLILVVMSDGGRAPMLKTGAGKGRWPITSVLLWGFGLNGGNVVGETYDDLRAKPLNPIFGTTSGGGLVTLEMGHIINAIYLQIGISYKLYSADHTPLSPILSH